jgi:hypothetical protein
MGRTGGIHTLAVRRRDESWMFRVDGSVLWFEGNGTGQREGGGGRDGRFKHIRNPACASPGAVGRCKKILLWPAGRPSSPPPKHAPSRPMHIRGRITGAPERVKQTRNRVAAAKDDRCRCRRRPSPQPRHDLLRRPAMSGTHGCGGGGGGGVMRPGRAAGRHAPQGGPPRHRGSTALPSFEAAWAPVPRSVSV